MDHKAGLTPGPESNGGPDERANHKVGLTTPPESDQGALVERINVLEQHTKALAAALRALAEDSAPNPLVEQGQGTSAKPGALRAHELLHAAGLKPALD